MSSPQISRKYTRFGVLEEFCLRNFSMTIVTDDKELVEKDSFTEILFSKRQKSVMENITSKKICYYEVYYMKNVIEQEE